MASYKASRLPQYYNIPNVLYLSLLLYVFCVGFNIVSHRHFRENNTIFWCLIQLSEISALHFFIISNLTWSRDNAKKNYNQCLAMMPQVVCSSVYRSYYQFEHNVENFEDSGSSKTCSYLGKCGWCWETDKE